MNRVLYCWFFVVLLTGITTPAHARFDIIDHTVRATSRGGAFVATADDGGAFYYNPAGLTRITGNLMQSDIFFAYRNTNYESLTGATQKIQQSIILPNSYAVFDTGTEKWKWGVGMYVPFGSTTRWGDDGALRYALTSAKLETIVLNPTVAYKAAENFSVGLGLDIYRGSVIARKMVNYAGLGGGDGLYELLSNEAYAAGYNIGFLWNPTKKGRIGISYRSGFDLMFQGKATLYNKPVPPFAAAVESTSVQAEYSFPDIFMVGYAYELTEKLTLEADFQWTNWSRFSGYYIDFDNNSASLVDQWVEKNYHDSFLYKVGAEYALTQRWDMRMGLVYSSDSVPAATSSTTDAFDPSNPSNRRYSAYLGWGYHKDKLRVNFMLGVTQYADRFVSNGASQRANGLYKTILPQVAIGFGWAF